MKADKSGMLKCLTSASVVYDDPSSLRIYSFDQGEVPATLKKMLLPNSMPDLVMQPGSAQDTQAGIRYALEHNVPIVPRGASTNPKRGSGAPAGWPGLVDMLRR